jgi:hypothetical protein
MSIGTFNTSGDPTGQYTSIATAGLTTNQGFKPGGGVWADSSDERIKTVHGDYESGLDAIKALRPVRYTFKGNDTDGPPKHAKNGVVSDPQPKDTVSVPYPNSFHYNDAVENVERIGLVAQEAEVPMPELVSKAVGWIDGKAVADLRNIDTGPLIFALINAVKMLAARVEALEATP